jgi:hypothetical protein
MPRYHCPPEQLLTEVRFSQNDFARWFSVKTVDVHKDTRCFKLDLQGRPGSRQARHTSS